MSVHAVNADVMVNPSSNPPAAITRVTVMAVSDMSGSIGGGGAAGGASTRSRRVSLSKAQILPETRVEIIKVSFELRIGVEFNFKLTLHRRRRNCTIGGRRQTLRLSGRRSTIEPVIEKCELRQRFT